MKTAVIKSKTLRIGVALVTMSSLLLTLILPATNAQGAVPATTSLDAGVAQAVANTNAAAALPSLAPVGSANVNTNSALGMYGAAGDAATSTAVADTATQKPTLETKILVQNLTKNADATTVENAPGDVIHVTATIKNLGPVDLSNYSAKIFAEKMFALGSVINPGDGGIAKENKYMEFPPISQSKDCNCTAKFEFTIKLNENICTDMKDLTQGGMTASIEDQIKKMNIGCGVAPAPVTPTAPTPVTPESPTDTAKMPPKHSENGPEMLFFVAIAAMAGYVMWKRKADVTE